MEDMDVFFDLPGEGKHPLTSILFIVRISQTTSGRYRCTAVDDYRLRFAGVAPIFEMRPVTGPLQTVVGREYGQRRIVAKDLNVTLAHDPQQNTVGMREGQAEWSIKETDVPGVYRPAVSLLTFTFNETRLVAHAQTHTLRINVSEIIFIL
ncbi:hypothetical protein F5887DRAFT_1160769 [Amanita rubescens]|nr:hypothetical protein F5887DRAFT_1160769 [Amanita rubescens]